MKMRMETRNQLGNIRSSQRVLNRHHAVLSSDSRPVNVEFAAIEIGFLSMTPGLVVKFIADLYNGAYTEEDLWSGS